jgi:hypothetical protein
VHREPGLATTEEIGETGIAADGRSTREAANSPSPAFQFRKAGARLAKIPSRSSVRLRQSARSTVRRGQLMDGDRMTDEQVCENCRRGYESGRELTVETSWLRQLRLIGALTVLSCGGS